jgi:hypothetical protein
MLVTGCNEKEKANPETVSGKIIGNSDCKSNRKIDTTSNFSCAEYIYNESGKVLMLKHINTGFNCCPDLFYCTVSLKSDTIVISEFENSSLCDCNCLYDMDIEIKGVESKSYQIKFIEPYCGDQEKLEFPVNLAVLPQGSYCVTRTNYPWGI